MLTSTLGSAQMPNLPREDDLLAETRPVALPDLPSQRRHAASSGYSLSFVADMLGGFQDKTKTVLTMDDLSAALGEYGINARKPEFYL